MDKKSLYISLFCCSVIFVLLFSTSSSPLYTINNITTDAGVFQTIGYNWLNGVVPYKDLFDQKGPLIYFVNTLGYWLTGNRYGISLIEILCLFFSLVYCYKLLRIEFKVKYSFLLTLFTLANLSIIFDGGDMVEELVLPFLFASFFYAYQWFKRLDATGETTMPKKIPFLLGIVLGVSFLTRLTNAIGACLIAVFMLGILLYKKEFKATIASILIYISGVLVTVAPFFLYFYYKGALGDMWYCVITYNIKYAVVPSHIGVPIFDYVLGFSSSWILTIMSLILLLKTKSNRLLSFTLLTIGLFTSVYFFKGRGYLHYAMIAIPYIPLYLNQFKIMKNDGIGIKAYRLYQTVFCIFTLTFILGLGYETIRYVVHKSTIFNGEKELYAKDLIFQNYIQLLTFIPNSDYDSMVAVDCRPSLYLCTMSRPAYRFFILQDFQTSFDKDLNTEMKNIYMHGKAKWIIFNNRQPNSTLTRIINQRYTPVKSNAFFSLYRLNDALL